MHGHFARLFAGSHSVGRDPRSGPAVGGRRYQQVRALADLGGNRTCQLVLLAFPGHGRWQTTCHQQPAAHFDQVRCWPADRRGAADAACRLAS